MIGQQCALLSKNRRLTICLVMSAVMLFLVMIYQEKCETSNGAAKADILNSVLQSDEPIEAVKKHISDIFADSNAELYADSFFDEYMICMDIKQYIETVGNYPEYLDNIMRQYRNVGNFSGMTKERINKSRFALKYYEKCSDSKTIVGNYMSMEKFFSGNVLDVFIYILAFLIGFSSVVYEREHGITKLVFPNINGGRTYFFSKLLACVLITVGVTALVYLGKLAVLTAMYGACDWNADIHSMSGYLSSPWNLSIGEYFGIYMLWKIMGAALTMLISLILASLRVSEIVYGVLNMLVYGIGFAFRLVIKSTSRLVLLRDLSIVQLNSPDYWVKNLIAYPIGLGDRNVGILLGNAVAAGAFVVIVGGMIVAGCVLFHRGLKSSSMSVRGRKKICYNFTGNMFQNEIYYILFFKKTILAFTGIIAFYGLCICNFGQNQNDEVRYEQKLVSLLNSKTTDEAGQWLSDRLAFYDELTAQLEQKQLEYANGLISEAALNSFSAEINQQLEFRRLVEKMNNQLEGIKAATTGTVIPKFEYTPLSGSLYGTGNIAAKCIMSFAAACFINFAVLTLLPGEREFGINRIISSQTGGEKAIRMRALILAAMTFLLSLALEFLYLMSIKAQYSLLGFDTPIQSFEAFRKAHMNMQVGQAYFVDMIIQSMKWALVAAIGYALSSKIRNVVWCEVLGIMFLGIPYVLWMLEIEWVQKMNFIGWLIIGQENFAQKPWILLVVIFELVMCIAGVRLAARGWCRE